MTRHAPRTDNRRGLGRNITPAITILDAIDDPHLFAQFFRDTATWTAWRAFLAALFALPMSPELLAIYRECTGREPPPQDASTEAWLVIGRRGGKSFVLALIAVFLACFWDWRQYLAIGERGTIMVVAADRKQARVIMRYIKALLTETPMLAPLVEGETQESLDLTNRITIEVHTASFRTTRGYAIVAALCDELAFWQTDESSSEPDVEVINALRPGMATIPGAMLLCASSPYSRRGALWNAYQRHFGKAGDPVLVWQAATRTMNPTVPQALVDQALQDDPSVAGAEYLGQFRSDLEAFVSREAVEACVSSGVRERAPQPVVAYTGFCDPSGGSADSMTLCIGHNELMRRTVVIDAVREIKPPFSPEFAVGEFCTLLKTYRITKVVGDRYGGEWPREQFKKFGVHYEPAAKPKSDLYVDALALLNSGRVDLLDLPRLVSQFVGLERRVARSGRDSIDHQPGGHDDLANAVAGVASTMINRGTYNIDAFL